MHADEKARSFVPEPLTHTWKLRIMSAPEASFLSLKSTVFMRFDAISEFQKCAETSSIFRPYRVDTYNKRHAGFQSSLRSTS